jgi:peptide/nickel transport system permease protein
MAFYVLRRIGVSLLMLWLTSVLLFVALRVIPGDPAFARSGRPGVSAEQLEQIRRDLGLDRSIPEQYARWAVGVLQGDFGKSYFNDFSTAELISQRLLPTVELVVASVLLALLIALPLGILAGLRANSRADRVVSAYASAGMAMPPFWLGILIISLLAIQLRLLPTRGYVSVFDNPVENVRLMILPAITMAIVISAPLLRFLRASMIETLTTDYVRTARGKGLGWRRVVLRHAFPNAVLPTLTFVGLVVGSLFGGIVVIEWIFGWQGLGALALDSVLKRDYAVLQGVVLLAAAAFYATTLAVDLLTFALDPRLRAEYGG